MTAQAPRIAVVYRNLAGLSGTPNTVFSHAAFLAGLGYRVDLVAERIDRGRIESNRNVHGLRVRRLLVPRRYRLEWFARQAGRRVRNGYDFVAGHGHHDDVQHVVSLHNCTRLAHLKVHGSEIAEPDPVTRLHDRILTEQRFALCIANSALMRDELVGRYAVPSDKVRVIHPGHDPARFNAEARARFRDPVRRELEVGPDEWLLGVITSGAFDKRGVDIAIDAFARLPAPISKRSHLVVIGKTSRTRRYADRIAAHGLERQVRLLPPVRDVERYYHALDVYLHPARFEEFGQSVQEAMACGVPVLTNRNVGATERLSEAAYERVPERSSIDGLAAQIEALVTDDAARRSSIDAGLEAVRGNTLRENCERTLQVYREFGLPPSTP